MREVLAVGNSTLIVDGLNALLAFGTNKFGELGDGSHHDSRCTPGKLGRDLILDEVLMLRGHYQEPQTNSDGTTEPGKTTLSFMTAPGDIYVWGCFDIPANGSEPSEIPPSQDLTQDRRRKKANKKKRGPQVRYMDKPTKLNFLFDHRLKIKIKNYQIDASQIVVIAEPQSYQF